MIYDENSKLPPQWKLISKHLLSNTVLHCRNLGYSFCLGLKKGQTTAVFFIFLSS